MEETLYDSVVTPPSNGIASIPQQWSSWNSDMPNEQWNVTGTITAASVIAFPGQNVTAGDFDALTDALFSSTAYRNIHTTAFPAGEIRTQLEQEHHGRDFRRRDGGNNGGDHDQGRGH